MGALHSPWPSHVHSLLQGRSLEECLLGLQPIGRACAYRALAACIPATALCAQGSYITGASGCGSCTDADAAASADGKWSLLLDGMLMQSLSSVAASSDGTLTYHSMAAATACLERMNTLWRTVHTARSREVRLQWEF
jgi:hypothetical protein